MPKINSTYYQEVKKKLDAFARRYYLNNLLQNSAIFLASTTALLMVISVLEYFLKNDSLVRAIVFYAFLFSAVLGLLYLVILPALKALGMAKRMTNEDLSRQVGYRMKEVDDKLLNILLLDRMNISGNKEIIRAAINQKSGELKGIPFHLSATLRKGVKFVRNAGVFLVLIMLMGMTFPDLFNYGTKRVVFYNSEIEQPPPFTFNLQSDLQAVRNETFQIHVKIEGDLLPGSVFINTEGKKRKAAKVNANEYSYTVKNIRDNFSFRFYAEGIESKEYNVEVLGRPTIMNFEIDIAYPTYLRMKPQNLKNVGNINIPEGSRISWKVKISEGEFFKLNFDGNSRTFGINDGIAKFDSAFINSCRYNFAALHSNGLMSDSINYRISVSRDQFPVIEIVEQADSLNSKNVFVGKLSDDYGISSFRFGYKINSEKEVHYKQLDIKNNSLNWDFLYEIDWNKWDLDKGDEVLYFFEVWDNDGVNGAKYAQSRKMIFRLLDEDEINRQKEELSDQIEEEMEEVILEARKLREDIEELQKDMVDEKKLDWSSKRKIEELMKRNESLKKSLNDINSKNKQKNRFENNLEHSDEINQKRNELERLMEEILDDKTLEKLKELESLMDKLKKNELQKAMEEIEISNEQLEKELDRSLELFRQLEFETQLDKVVENLENLSEEQKELRERTEENDKGDLAGEQEKLKEEFESWEEEMDKLNEMNEKLENKHQMDNQDEERREVNKEMKDAKEELDKGKKKNAGKNQKNAEQKMEEMKDDLNAMKMDMQAQSMEDIQSLRNTLENLIEISFRQEDIMEEMKEMGGDDPRFSEATKEQRAILDGMAVVEDSLRELSKRIVQIETTVNRELILSRNNMEKSIKAMTERKLDNVSRHQQLAMTSINNLSLLLDEVVNQLQQQMMQSAGQCKKAGNSKPSPTSMKKMQQQLNKQLKDMKRMMEEGKSKGEKNGQRSEAESLAKMAAEQAKIREEMRKMSENANHQDAKDLLKIGEMMEETERDIVNREISQETILRQEKILNKLLEAETSERQQDIEEKREAISGNDKKNGNLYDIKEYYKSRYNDHEELVKQNISFSRYFKGKVEEYFKTISQ